ncbi:hypothetical protein DL766_002941 [Monosporascus sp. MC13-8B]|uniref:DUF262 domain-containing protein n=1 Tax=Monosporascus cannonballus TaxID=155416 RepID=A0ABY0GZ38_9PEZI|nr:hypothetical protein DL762_007521 [Monosporascus cannonballus]RYO83534.1 hypothetical protein DL763_007859 [Monosporascus cannonballus]RYP34574.1 hypothetical protein DL766_002941 [Monosporascus sp. MC13-8B]
MWLMEGQDRITNIFYFFKLTDQCFGSKQNDMEFAVREGNTKFSESIWNKQLSKEDVMRIARKVQPETSPPLSIFALLWCSSKLPTKVLAKFRDLNAVGFCGIQRLMGQNKGVNGLLNEASSLYKAYPDSSHLHRGFAATARDCFSVHLPAGGPLLDDSRTAASIWNEAIRTRLLDSEEAGFMFVLSEVLIEFGSIAFQQGIYTNTVRDPAEALHKALRHDYKVREEGKINLTRCKRGLGYLPVHPQAPNPRKPEDIVQQPLREWLQDLATKLGLSTAEMSSMADDAKQRHPEFGTWSLVTWDVPRNNFIWANPTISSELLDKSEWHYLSSRTSYMDIFASAANGLA